MGADGGRIAARGFQYQYLRTLEALLASSYEGSVVACRIEGPVQAATALDSVDAVDFDLIDAEGVSVVAVQVKSAAAGREMRAPRALEVLLDLVSRFSSQRYELVTNAIPDVRCERLAARLSELRGQPQALRGELEELFVKAPAMLARIRALSSDQWVRLAQTRIDFDGRDDAQLREELNLRLRFLRERSGRGLSRRSGGLVLGFLVAEVLRRAADPGAASWSLADFNQCFQVDDDVLCTALGRQDFGVVVGPFPPVPEIERPELVEQVVAAFRGTAPAVPVCLVSGLSGIGKSSLAASYVAQHAYRYDLVFWLDASTPESLAGSFQRLLAHLGGGEDVPTDPTLVRERVHAQLQGLPGPWLLVFDDASPAQADAWLPRQGRGHVLVTSLARSWRRVQGRVEVEPLPRERALELLTLRLELEELSVQTHLEALNDLADALGRWPLAIELAAGYLLTCGIDPAHLDAYRSRLLSAALDDDRSLPPGYPQTLVAAVRLSLDRLYTRAEGHPEVAGGALALLRVLCYFAPQRIPLHLSAASVFIPVEHIPPTGHVVALDETSSPMREMLRELFDISFVRPDAPLPLPSDIALARIPGIKDSLSINTVLQLILRRMFAQRSAPDQALLCASAHTNSWLLHALDHGLSEWAWELSQHASALAEQVQELELVSTATATLLGNLAGFHGRHGRHGIARELLEQELRWQIGSPSANPLITAQCRIQLASLINAMAPAEVCDHIVRHLTPVLPYLAGYAVEDPVGAARHGTDSVLILQVRSSRSPGHGEVDNLLDQFRALADRLPLSPYLRTLYQTHEAGELLAEGQASDAEQVAADTLTHLEGQLWSDTAADARRLLIEALAVQDKWAEANSQYTLFRNYLGPQSLYRFSVNHLVHNVGLACATQWVLFDNAEAVELLHRMIDDVGPYLDHLADDEFERTRFTLLRAVHGAARAVESDSPAAEGVEDFLHSMEKLEGQGFSANPEQASAWDAILLGLPVRIGAHLTQKAHEASQARGQAAIDALPATMTIELEEAVRDDRALAHLALSTDPAFAGSTTSNLDFLAHKNAALAGPRAIMVLEPQTMLLVSTLQDETIEAHLHSVCGRGFRLLQGPNSVVPVAAELSLRPDGSTVVLEDSEGGVLARASTLLSRAWRDAARGRGTVWVIYGFAFDLADVPSSQKLLAVPHAAGAAFRMGCAQGLIAAAIVPWTEYVPSAHPGPRPPRRQNSRKKARRKK
ncbi:ATP-binding protein [Streptomyces sp. NPDC051976]|uniref:ATP-binding protein n=1 Tax=Streptomyces sp. NPDC051976 TaxID=3154947 RepID=UPI00341745A5